MGLETPVEHIGTLIFSFIFIVHSLQSVLIPERDAIGSTWALVREQQTESFGTVAVMMRSI